MSGYEILSSGFLILGVVNPSMLLLFDVWSGSIFGSFDKEMLGQC